MIYRLFLGEFPGDVSLSGEGHRGDGFKERCAGLFRCPKKKPVPRKEHRQHQITISLQHALSSVFLWHKSMAVGVVGVCSNCLGNMSNHLQSVNLENAHRLTKLTDGLRASMRFIETLNKLAHF